MFSDVRLWIGRIPFRVGTIQDLDVVSSIARTVALVALAGVVGCTKPIPRGYGSHDPTGRIEAMLETAARGDRSKIPELIGELDSDDSAVRFTAIRTLERLTGQTLGYDFAGTEQERREATDRWVAWWESGVSTVEGSARVTDGRSEVSPGDAE